MKNTTIKNMMNDLKTLKADLDNTQDITKLQREHDEAKAVIADLLRKIDELTDIQDYDPAIVQEIDNLKALNLTAADKLTMLESAIFTAEESHKKANEEYTRIKKGIDTLTELSTINFQKRVDNIKTPEV